MKTREILKERKKAKKLIREESKRNKKMIDKQYSISNEIASVINLIKDKMSDIDSEEIVIEVKEKYYYDFKEAIEREIGNAYSIEKGKNKTELIIKQSIIEI